MGWWIAATVLGWQVLLVFPFLFVGLSLAIDSKAIWFAALLGGLIAVPQWLVLRQHVPRAAYWLVANALAWGALWMISGTAIDSGMDVVAVALLPPIVTSFALWLLLGRLPRAGGGIGVPIE